MKKFVFSAVFGSAGQAQRIRFLSNTLKSYPGPVQFLAFNTSGIVEADFEVVNAASRFKPQIGDPLEYLDEMLETRFPTKKRLLMDHVVGEFGKNKRVYEANVYKIIRMILEFERVLNDFEPDYVYLWNQFNAFHRIIAQILDDRGVRYGFFHDGVLPGSIALDPDGEMGESWIATDPQKFMSVPVSSDDVARASRFLAGLKGAKVSRHPQTESISVQQTLVDARLNDRPIVFLAGQNDWHAGIKPKSAARAFHSHIYPGSAEALVDLDRIAGEIGVTILFKPHPLSKDRFLFLRAEDLQNSVVLGSTSMDACLQIADLVTTIASQTCYVALIDDAPVMMLGKNQITGKGLTYDVATVDDIGKTIELGVQDPLRAGRSEALAHHVAQLERAYLFDYSTMETDYFRRGPSAAARMMALSAEMPKRVVIDMLAAGAVI